MTGWKFNNPVKIIFGCGAVDKIKDFIGPGRAILFTTSGSSKRGLVDNIKNSMGNLFAGVYDGVKSNPTFDDIKDAYLAVCKCKFDSIIAVGGGSAIDTAKSVAAMIGLKDENFLEAHLKKGISIPDSFSPLPIVAVPTTAGTGSEVTCWGTVWDMNEKRKYSISHDLLYPKVAILDPVLTVSLPQKETLYCGLDALSHAMEAIWNRNCNPVSDALAKEAISLVHTFLPPLKNDLNNIELREKLLRAGLLAGLSFSNTKTALAHAISYPLTSVFGLPHGLACSLPLIQIIKYIGDNFPQRTQIISSAMACSNDAKTVVEKLETFFNDIGVSPGLTNYGIRKEEILELFPEYYRDTGRTVNFIAETSKDDIIGLIRNMIN